MTTTNDKILRGLISDLREEVASAEASLVISEQVLVAARQRIVSIKLKIAALEELLSNVDSK